MDEYLHEKIAKYIESNYRRLDLFIGIALTVAGSVAAAYGYWFVVTLLLLVATHSVAKH